MHRRSILKAAAGLPLIATRTASAQTFPSRPVRIVVPFAAGGPTDVMARGLSQKLSEALGQSVVVDNRPGGGAQIAAAQVKQSPADGHTIFIGDIGALAVNPSLYRSLSYDPIKDFAPLTMLMSAPTVLIVRTDSPIKGIREMVAMTKAGRPLTFASQGVGTGGHLCLEMFKNLTGLDIAHVPYKGSAPAMQDVIAGQVDGLFDVLPSALPQHQAGKVRTLAAVTAKRIPQLPDVPTAVELGFPDLAMDVWFAAVALAGTPDAAVRRLSAELGKAMRDPSVSKRFADIGFTIEPGTPEALGAFMKSEADRWGAVVRKSGARAD